MNHSFIALNRVAEERSEADAKYRETLERDGKPMLSQARQLTDADLFEKLRCVGIELDKTSYAEIAEHALSAQEIAKMLITGDVRSRCKQRFDEDWVWMALTVLWERLFPQWPSFEQLDDAMQAGYARSETDEAAACELWLRAWDDFLLMYDKGSFTTVGEFDDAFGGTQFVSNWISDLEMALGNAAANEPRWHGRRIQFCEEFLRRFPGEDDLIRENMRRALAEATFGQGDRARGDALFEQWLRDDPRWGWGWIGWSDCHSLFAADADRDPQRAEALLKQGLDVSGVRDRADLLERLADLCRDQGRNEEAARFKEEGEAARRADADVDELPPASSPVAGGSWPISLPAVPARSTKIGRNEPCPCGSGKKYKKCCLAEDEAQARQAVAAPLPAPGAISDEDEASFGPEMVEDPLLDQNLAGDKTRLAPEVESKLNQIWDEFEALKQPGTEQMDGFLTKLIALPPEATAWNDILHRFARLKHPDLPGVFRRIAASVPHTKAIGMAFFYWAAAEEFTRHGGAQMLPEVAAGFRRLDADSYDADALSHVEDFLLAGGFESETLQLAEHFLPIERADDGLMPYAVPQRCNLIFELRTGRALRDRAPGPASTDVLARELRLGIEEDIYEDSARLAAGIVIGGEPAPAWERGQFELVTGDISRDNQAWRDCLRLFGMIIRVAQEAWRHEARPPGCTLSGLTLLLNSVYDWKDRRAKKSKKSSGNLLDYLRPAGLESRLVQSCRGMIGVNTPRARLLLEAHGCLARSALLHELVSPGDAAQTEKELARLRRALDALG